MKQIVKIYLPIFIIYLMLSLSSSAFAQSQSDNFILLKDVISSGGESGASPALNLPTSVLGENLGGFAQSANFNLGSGYPQGGGPEGSTRLIEVYGTIDDNSATVVVTSSATPDPINAIVSNNTFNAQGVLIEEGANTITVTATDLAGNFSTQSITVYLDTIPPFRPTQDYPIVTPTNVESVTLGGTKEANTSVWINNIEVIPLNSLTTWTYVYTLTHGENHLYISTKDQAGNESTSVYVYIVYDSTAPVIISVTDDGDYTLDLTQLHCTWSGQDPESGIAEYQYAITTNPNTGIPPDVVGWTSAGLNTEVTVTGLNLTSGVTYFFFVKAMNTLGSWSDIGVSDGITTNTAPEITDFQPTQYSRFYEEEAIQLSATATDIDGDTLEYQFSVDMTVLQPWSTLSTYTWQTQIGDNGRHNLKVEVRDNKLGVDETQNEIHIFLKPIYPPSAS